MSTPKELPDLALDDVLKSANRPADPLEVELDAPAATTPASAVAPTATPAPSAAPAAKPAPGKAAPTAPKPAASKPAPAKSAPTLDIDSFLSDMMDVTSSKARPPQRAPTPPPAKPTSPPPAKPAAPTASLALDDLELDVTQTGAKPAPLPELDLEATQVAPKPVPAAQAMADEVTAPLSQAARQAALDLPEVETEDELDLGAPPALPGTDEPAAPSPEHEVDLDAVGASPTADEEVGFASTPGDDLGSAVSAVAESVTAEVGSAPVLPQADELDGGADLGGEQELDLGDAAVDTPPAGAAEVELDQDSAGDELDAGVTGGGGIDLDVGVAGGGAVDLDVGVTGGGAVDLDVVATDTADAAQELDVDAVAASGGEELDLDAVAAPPASFDDEQTSIAPVAAPSPTVDEDAASPGPSAAELRQSLPEVVTPADPEAPPLPLGEGEPAATPAASVAGLTPDLETIERLRKLAGPAADPARAGEELRAALRGEPYDPKALPELRALVLGIGRVLVMHGTSLDDLVDSVLDAMKQ